MPYKVVSDGFHAKKLLADFLQAKCDFRRKSAGLRFWAPLWGLVETYDGHLKLIGKRVVDFLLVLIELFSLGVRLRRYEQILIGNRQACRGYEIIHPHPYPQIFCGYLWIYPYPQMSILYRLTCRPMQRRYRYHNW